MNVSSEP